MDPSMLRDVAIRLANDTKFGLAAYFYGRGIGRIRRVAEALEGCARLSHLGPISLANRLFRGPDLSGPI
jgi:hypothetical protein